tara:strand:- start:321 stop:545 length:225 start_codon:yes stop_codon:yes gene_type:complete
MNLPVLMTEALAIGVLTVVLGYLVVYVMNVAKPVKGRQAQMALGFFVLGATIHLFCEFTGVNRWYCKNGHACKR